MALIKVESTIGTAEFGKHLGQAQAYQQPCDNYRQFMTADWCSYCHYHETQH
jgi:hypothetical protein